jgi:deoxyribose-phosphate aldolase
MYDSEMYGRTVISPFLPFLTNDIIEKEIIDAYKNRIRSIIVESGQAPLLKKLEAKYANGYTRTGITIAYPFGGMSTETKVMLAKDAMNLGIDEINFGTNINAALSGDMETFKDDIKQVLDAVEGKVNIIPMAWVIKIPLAMIDKICNVFLELGITSIKTSPGLHYGSMKVEHIEYINKHYGDKFTIEVSGRCRTRQLVEDMTDAGASYYHLSQWRRICSHGLDYQYDYAKKQGSYCEYLEKL